MPGEGGVFCLSPPLACGHLPQGGDFGALSKVAVAEKVTPLGEMSRSDRGGVRQNSSLSAARQRRRTLSTLLRVIT